MMRKGIAFFVFSLVLVYLLSPAACADRQFQPNTAQDAKLQALNCLMNVAFSPEYGDERDSIIRWQQPIYIYAGGVPTREDLKKLDAFIMEIALRVPGMPNIYRTESEYKANITMYFVNENEMGDYVSGYEKGNIGMVTYWYTDEEIYRAEIAISADTTDQSTRNHLIMEEFINGIGLGNDHDMYEDSIIYQYSNTAQKLSEVDWLMLNMIYSPEVEHGMSSNDAYNALLQNILAK